MIDLAMIVAVSKNNVIGRDNQLPWHIPEDLQWFKRKTMGKPMIMGRKTFESFGRPLPDRTHIVISNTKVFEYDRVLMVDSVDEAIKLGLSVAVEEQATELMIVGGGTIYSQALPQAKRIYRTLVDIELEGDTFFPELGREWKVVAEEKKQQGDLVFFFQTIEKSL